MRYIKGIKCILVFLFSLNLSVAFANSTLSVTELTIEAGQEFVIQPGFTTLEIATLEMKEGSRIVVPVENGNQIFLIEEGIFHKGAAIISAGTVGDAAAEPKQPGGKGTDGSNITFQIASADFRLGATPTSEPFFKISSTGGEGGQGGRGGHGRNAARKHCSGGDGHPAGNGGTGASGGSGGNGGNILATISLIPDHPTISPENILLESLAGPGGQGGEGGSGGRGAHGRCCAKVLGKCTFKRGGYRRGKSGAAGESGPAGNSGNVQLTLDN